MTLATGLGKVGRGSVAIIEIGLAPNQIGASFPFVAKAQIVGARNQAGF